MFHQAALVAALIIFCAGTVFKVSAWFRNSLGPQTADSRTSRRVASAFGGIVRTVFSRKILTLGSVLFFDVIFQVKVLRQDRLRWVMHLCIFGGFLDDAAAAPRAWRQLLGGPFLSRIFGDPESFSVQGMRAGRSWSWGSPWRSSGALSGRRNVRRPTPWISGSW